MSPDNQELITNLLCREIADLKLTIKILEERCESLKLRADEAIQSIQARAGGKLTYDEAIQSIQARAGGSSTDDVLRLLQLHDCTTSGLFGGVSYSERGTL